MNRHHGNPTRIAAIVSLFLVVLIGLSTTQGAAQSLNDQLPIYLVRFAEEPMATYTGDIPNLAATSIEVTGETKLDAGSVTSLAYRGYLATKQVGYVRSMEQQLGRPLNIAYQYFYANNGLALHLTAGEAAQVAKMAGIVSVKKDEERELTTDNGPTWIGAPDIWNGSGTGGLGSTQGEGMVVGIIDTGINPSNPSFASVGPVDGYVHINPYGSGNYTPGSYCNTVDPTFCNDKLIGAWGYSSVNGGDPTDNNGHGSHTASTTAGNVVTATISAPTTTITRTISGVAPHANIIAYSACCTLSALAAAIDQVVVDQVDVVNYSIGSIGCAPSNIWGDFDTVGFLNARNAGIFVTTSAGNCGPGAKTVGSPADAPWLTAVAASTHDRVFSNTLANMSGGTSPPADIVGRGLTSAYGPAPIVYAGDYGNAPCNSPFAPGTWTNGEIVVCDRGQVGRVEKGQNVLVGGAGGYVLANTAADGNSLVADAHVLPAVHITYDDGVDLKNWLASGSGHMASIDGWSVAESVANGDVMASFSSRGANQVIDIVSPSVAAPGVDILAATGTNGVIAWDLMSGTSMASPHVAGSAALLMALHPDWTPAEVQSALMTTAKNSLLDSDGVSPADPFDYGSGRVEIGQAARAGLVLDETEANYLAANPSGGGDPKTLNLASMQNSNCMGTCSWTRTVTSTQSTAVDWTASANTPAGMIVTVSPNDFTLPPGGSQTINIKADINGLPAGTWAFAEVLLSAAGQPMATLPMAVIPQPGVPTIDVDPDKLNIVQPPDTVMTYTLNIDNAGSTDLSWSINEAINPAPGFSPEDHPWLGANNSMVENALGLSEVAGEVPSVAPQAPNAINKVIWDQPTSGSWGGVSDYWNNQNRGAYSANDFVLSQPETISLIFVDGFDNDNKLANQPAITWLIYPDAGGAPAGHPEDGGGTELWSFSAAPGDPGVDITNNAISLDLVAAGQTLVSLPSGTYWLTVYPTYTNPQWRWNWYMASPLGYTAQLIDPTDIFESGFTSWTPWTNANNNIVDLAFRLEGPSICNQPSSIPWVSVSPSSGLTGPAGSFPVDVTFDSTGLQTGTYTGTMCVNSNDPSTPVAEIPLSLTVSIAPDLQIDKDDGGLTVAPGDTLTYTLTFTNTGNQGATGVVLTDTVPANTTFNPAASTAGWSCIPDNSAGSTCTLAIGNVSVGGGSSADFVVTVNSPFPPLVSTIDNTAEIGDDGSHGPDANPDDNVDTVTTQLNRRILIPIMFK